MTKRTLILLLVMWLLAIFAPLMHGMTKQQFDREADQQAKVFGCVNYTASLVSLDFFRTLTEVDAFALSTWDQHTREFRFWVVDDKALDTMADTRKLPHLTKREKRDLQRKAIVHELVHGWGVDSEEVTVALTGVILHHTTNDASMPKRWRDILIKREPVDPNVLK